MCEYGYILKIHSSTINSTYISRASSKLVADLTFDADILKPEIGDQLDGKVSIITENGIVVIIQDIIKALIHVKNMNGYKFISNEYKKDGNVIAKNSIVRLAITNSRYTNQDGFQYIAELKSLVSS
jgi:ribosomal protein S1